MRRLPATGINVADKTSDAERFANVRAEAYRHLRTLFETGQIMIPEEDELINELTQLKYKIVNSNGTIRLEEKEEMKKQPLLRQPETARHDDVPVVPFRLSLQVGHHPQVVLMLVRGLRIGDIRLTTLE